MRCLLNLGPWRLREFRLKIYHQGDPRGCALYVYSDKDMETLAMNRSTTPIDPVLLLTQKTIPCRMAEVFNASATIRRVFEVTEGCTIEDPDDMKTLPCTSTWR